MNKTVSIEFQYFEVCCFENDKKTESKYDLQEWIKTLFQMPLDARLQEIGEIKGRLENIDLTEDGQYYILNFMRMNEISNTYIVRKNEAAQHIDLNEDEYIGRNTVVLYDPKISVIMVQKNRGSYGVSAIESYINSFNEPESLCYLRPISDEFNSDRQDGAYLKLDVRFANTRDFRPRKSKAFEKIIDACNEIEGLTAHIEIGLGYKRGEELNPETIQEMISDLRDPANKTNIRSAKVKYSDDQKSEIYDLLDNLVHDAIPFQIPSRGELSVAEMSEKMSIRYGEGTRAKILRLLRSE